MAPASRSAAPGPRDVVDEVGQPVREEPGLAPLRSGLRSAGSVSAEDLAGAVDVVVHRLDERVDALERHHPAQPFDERHLDLDAVELEVVAVQDVGLDPALALAVEGRVGADADRRRVASPVSSRRSQPA